MDPRTGPDRRPPVPEPPPAPAGLLPAAEPDADLAAAYAAWRCERAEPGR
jgi:hypothetical protein